MNILFDGSIENVTTRMDNTIKVVIGTQELPNENMATLFGLKRGGLIKILLSDSNIQSEVVEAVDKTELTDTTKRKSQSKRLRDVLYRLWEQEGSKGESEQFYQQKMENIIEHFKSKLEPR